MIELGGRNEPLRHYCRILFRKQERITVPVHKTIGEVTTEKLRKQKIEPGILKAVRGKPAFFLTLKQNYNMRADQFNDKAKIGEIIVSHAIQGAQEIQGYFFGLAKIKMLIPIHYRDYLISYVHSESVGLSNHISVSLAPLRILDHEVGIGYEDCLVVYHEGSGVDPRMIYKSQCDRPNHINVSRIAESKVRHGANILLNNMHEAYKERGEDDLMFQATGEIEDNSSDRLKYSLDVRLVKLK